MTTRAYILIETQVGAVRRTLAGLRALDAVQSADIITGDFDIIALIEGADMAAVAETVTGRVQELEGVRRTITCVAVSAR